MKTKQKKEFWNMSWNPVHGCEYGCVYCFARKIDWRYAWEFAEKEVNYWIKNGLRAGNDDEYWMIVESVKEDLQNFKPTWLESNYVREFPRKPSIIFVNSMSDPAYWKHEWYEKILKRITENMQHTFVILTKQPDIYRKYTFPHNTILGITSINEISISVMMFYFDEYKIKYNNKLLLSVEPIQEKIRFNYIKNIENIDWIHVGEESGNRKGRIRATMEMIQPFFDLDIPVFMKDNLERLFPGQLRKEFPKI